jgi:PAS domain S-box-containing protein
MTPRNLLRSMQFGPSETDTPMAGMVDGYDGLSMQLDQNSLDKGNDGKIYKPLSPVMQQQVTSRNDDPNIVDQNTVDVPMSGAGAGPLPTSFGTQSTIGGGSILTEFTKRRNWSQRVVEELKDFLHILTPDGRIIYISPSAKQLTGYSQDDLVGKFIVDFIHPDDSGIYVREFNESIASGNTLRFFYRFRKQNGEYTIFESHGHPHLTSDASSSAGFCRGFFMMARPYPTKNAELLDSFLDHKIENERLTRRIADLKREEAEEAEDALRHWQKKQEGRSDVTPSDENDTLGSISNSTVIPFSMNPDVLAMPPPAKPLSMNTALTRQNLEDANASSKPDSITDKMARYEGATHIETIEMLTGLRYQDGERSRGISTGDMSPTLIKGDAGIAIPVDKDGRAVDKKKKIKVADEYVCTDCGIYINSPSSKAPI